jgi:hypothetical protein
VKLVFNHRDLNKGGALLPLLPFNLTLEYAIKKIHKSGWILIGTHQLLATLVFLI